MHIQISHFVLIALGIGIVSTVFSGSGFDQSFPVESANAQATGHGGGTGGGGHGMNMGMSGMGDGGQGMSMGMSGMGMGMSGMMGEGGHGMMMNVPGIVKQMCHVGTDMLPHYCEPSYAVMSSVKGLKISNVNPISDNELQVVINNMNAVSNATDQQNIVVVGGGGDLAGSTVLDIAGLQKITTELKLIGSGSIYSLGKIHLHLFPLTSP